MSKILDDWSDYLENYSGKTVAEDNIYTEVLSESPVTDFLDAIPVISVTPRNPLNIALAKVAFSDEETMDTAAYQKQVLDMQDVMMAQMEEYIKKEAEEQNNRTPEDEVMEKETVEVESDVVDEKLEVNEVKEELVEEPVQEETSKFVDLTPKVDTKTDYMSFIMSAADKIEYVEIKYKESFDQSLLTAVDTIPYVDNAYINNVLSIINEYSDEIVDVIAHVHEDEVAGIDDMDCVAEIESEESVEEVIENPVVDKPVAKPAKKTARKNAAKKASPKKK